MSFIKRVCVASAFVSVAFAASAVDLARYINLINGCTFAIQNLFRVSNLLKNHALKAAFVVWTGLVPAQADTITIAIRAFIPNSIPSNPGYISTITSAAGETITVIKSPNPLEDICYLTDQRTFTTDRNASARVSSMVSISLSESPPRIITSSGETGVTHAVKCSNGQQYCTDQASAANVTWGTISVSGSVVSIPVDASASNPCIWPSVVVPNIRYKGQFKLDLNSGKLFFQGEASQFPSIEAYVSYDDAPAVPIFQEAAQGSVMNIGDLKTIQKDISVPIFNGKWTSTDLQRRFTLEIKGDDNTFGERNSSGGSLYRQANLQSYSDGRRIISRPNDLDVLRFLDFSPAIIQEIQRRTPRPSYLVFARSGSKINAFWAGLLVTKDSAGKFREMKQPGDGPTKVFEFVK